MNSSKLKVLDVHWPLIFLVMLIGALGVYNLHSAAASKDPELYLTQLGWLLGGGLIAALVMLPDYRLTERVAYVLYAIVCVMLVGVLVQGEMAGGAQRWLRIGPVRFQPSELAKITTILCLARYFSTRVPPRGYSLMRLFRPMNPSRPLAVVALLAMGWDKDWLTDPLGTLARVVHEQVGTEAIMMGDYLWLRVGLLSTLIVGAALAIFMVIRVEQNQALLSPWPPGRRKRIILGIVVPTLAAVGGVALAWEQPFLTDPTGWILSYLNAGASAGGQFAELNESMTLRGILSFLALGYFGASFWASSRYRGPFADIVLAPIDLLALPALLVLVQPDLGTAGIIILIGMSMIMVVGVKPRSMAVLSVLGLIMAGVGWFGVLKDYQKRRILTFIDPEADIQGAGWNAFQSMIAVGSGRVTGKGHMGGTQTQLSFLPEQHTDFAFSVWAEEMGFVGCIVLLVLYVLLLALGLAIAADARDTFGALVAVGVSALILWQTLINVGMVIGVAPVVGLTLPLFSYGGSSLLTTMLGFGLLLNVHFRRRGA